MAVVGHLVVISGGVEVGGGVGIAVGGRWVWGLAVRLFCGIWAKSGNQPLATVPCVLVACGMEEDPLLEESKLEYLNPCSTNGSM